MSDRKRMIGARNVMQQVRIGRLADLPRAKVEDLPEKCEGCGACCGHNTIFCVPRVDVAEKEYLENEDLLKWRGIYLKRINGFLWAFTKSCAYLSLNRRCGIYNNPMRHPACEKLKRGSDTCLMMIAIQRDIFKGLF